MGIEEILKENGFSHTEDLSQISFELKGEHPEKIQELLSNILGLEAPNYNKDVGSINWDLSQMAYELILDRREFLNITAIEKHCGITRTSLLSAINRGQKSFSASNNLVAFVIKFFGKKKFLNFCRKYCAV